MIIQDIIKTSSKIGRKKSFVFTMNEIERRHFKPINIVETGTTRKPFGSDDLGDGNSTVLWGIYAQMTNSHVWTCDIDPGAMENCKLWTQDTKEFITYYIGDSVEFLSNLTMPIDLFYPDSFDSSAGQSEQASSHQLAEVKAAYHLLHPRTLILLDDVPPNFIGGKSDYSISFLLENGWKIINHEVKENQVLLSK